MPLRRFSANSFSLIMVNSVYMVVKFNVLRTPIFLFERFRRASTYCCVVGVSSGFPISKVA